MLLLSEKRGKLPAAVAVGPAEGVSKACLTLCAAPAAAAAYPAQ